MQHILARLLALVLGAFLLAAPAHAADEDGYDLWLRYRPLDVAARAPLQQSVGGIATLGAGT